MKEAKTLLQGKISAGQNPEQSPIATVVFISRSVAEGKREADWAAPSAGIIRQCPMCLHDSVVGHGRRQKQAHDEHHDWIRIRRGMCNLCGKTITFLPEFSLPYTHYSLIARSEALRRYFVEGCTWEAAAPPVKDLHRVADPSTLRRWFRELDSSQPPYSFLQRTLTAVEPWLRDGQILRHGAWQVCWRTVFPFLRRFWPLRI